jgi:hypothetical protein
LKASREETPLQIDREPDEKQTKTGLSVGDAILYLVIGTALTLFLKGPLERAIGTVTDQPIAQAVQWLGLEPTEQALPSLQHLRSQPQSSEAP